MESTIDYKNEFKAHWKKSIKREDLPAGICCSCKELTYATCPECGNWICRHCADLLGYCVGC